LKGAIRDKGVKTTAPDKTATCPLDKAQRQFRPSCPNRLWLSDFTDMSAWRGVAYVAFIIDAFTRRIVGW
jgi:transposase InsO family protein